jgi:hypothetical protein
MTKTYLVAGANWVAEVELANVETLSADDIRMEAATRAVEAKFGKRKDIAINQHPPISLSKQQKKENELHASLVELLTEELETGCGIGMLLCIMDNQDPDTYKEGEDHEWYVSSKSILENVGVPSLVERFNKKYPDKKKTRA